LKKLALVAIAALTLSQTAWGFTLRKTKTVQSPLLQTVAPALSRIANDIGGTIDGGYQSYKLYNLKPNETMEQVVERAVNRIWEGDVRVEVSDVELIDRSNPNQIEGAVVNLLSSDMSLPNRDEEIDTLTTTLLQALLADKNQALTIYSASLTGDFSLDAGVLVIVDSEANEVVVTLQGYGE